MMGSVDNLKKKSIIILSVVLATVLLFTGMSYFIGLQVFNGSTQLVTNENTAGCGLITTRNIGIR